MKTGYLIRSGQLRDLDTICQLLIDTWYTAYQDFIPASFLQQLSLERQKERHVRYMQNELCHYYVVENLQGQIVGFASYGKSRFEGKKEGQELYTIYVRSDRQGQGLGKSLLSKILDELASKKEETICVSVFEDNPFKRFYLKNGFEKTGTEMIDLGSFSLKAGIYCKSI